VGIALLVIGLSLIVVLVAASSVKAPVPVRVRRAGRHTNDAREHTRRRA
jgi:hypothetical protein